MYFPKLTEDVEMPVFSDGEIKKIKLSDYKDRMYVVIVFYPLDFTFVCPTELNAISDARDDFEKRDAVVLFVSRDSVYSHKAWASTPRDKNGIEGCKWPLVSDTGARLSKQFGLFDEDQDITKRATVILDKQLNMHYYCLHHDKIGRSVDEILRVVDAMDHVIKYGDTCAIDWRKK